MARTVKYGRRGRIFIKKRASRMYSDFGSLATFAQYSFLEQPATFLALFEFPPNSAQQISRANCSCLVSRFSIVHSFPAAHPPANTQRSCHASLSRYSLDISVAARADSICRCRSRTGRSVCGEGVSFYGLGAVFEPLNQFATAPIQSCGRIHSPENDGTTPFHFFIVSS